MVRAITKSPSTMAQFGQLFPGGFQVPSPLSFPSPHLPLSLTAVPVYIFPSFILLDFKNNDDDDNSTSYSIHLLLHIVQYQVYTVYYLTIPHCFLTQETTTRVSQSSPQEYPQNGSRSQLRSSFSSTTRTLKHVYPIKISFGKATKHPIYHGRSTSCSSSKDA